MREQKLPGDCKIEGHSLKAYSTIRPGGVLFNPFFPIFRVLTNESECRTGSNVVLGRNPINSNKFLPKSCKAGEAVGNKEVLWSGDNGMGWGVWLSASVRLRWLNSQVL